MKNGFEHNVNGDEIVREIVQKFLKKSLLKNCVML